MKRALRWIYRRLRVIALRHDLALWKLTIKQEQELHAAFPERQRRMRLEVARLEGEIDRLTDRFKVNYSFGPCMKGKRQ